MKTFLGWILSFVIAIVLFCIVIVIIPFGNETVEITELTYIFVDDDGNKYNIFENNVHGAADDWAFLFEDDNNKENKQDQTYLPNKDYIGENMENDQNGNISGDITKDGDLEDILDNDLYDELDGNINNVDTGFSSCHSPWNVSIKHGDFILAYQQRNDEPTICNIQKRYCNDGVLEGNYKQSSCRKDIKYTYTKGQVISFNNQEKGELIQNPGYAKNDAAQFDTNGKINPEVQSPNTNWDNDKNNVIIKPIAKKLTKDNHYNCISPWGESINHGQFTKAYKLPKGFIDQGCKVELRLCLDGDLKGKYSYKNCEHKNVTHLDYIGGNDDVTKVTPEEMIKTLVDDDKGGLFGWIGNLFK